MVTTAGAGVGLMLGLTLAIPARAAMSTGGRPWPGGSPTEGTEIGAWVVVAPDNTVTLRAKQQEMGQGVFTSLAMLLAEGLDADWDNVRVEYVSANRNVREDNVYGNIQTAGSGAVRNNWNTLLLAGATVRERLKEAAALLWAVPRSELTTENSVVSHLSSGRSATYGELATAAVGVELDAEPPIKSEVEFRLVGRDTPRVEVPLKVNGSAIFGIDIKLPDMVYAATTTCPVYGGRVLSYDADAVRGMVGVIDVVAYGEENNPTGLRSGVAVVADTYWHARKALDRLPIEWDLGDGAAVSSEGLREGDIAALNAREPGGIAEEEGDALSVIAAAGQNVIVGEYEAPHQSHAPMEPINCTAQVTRDRVDIWMGTQTPSGVLAAAAETAGVAPENVFVHNCFLGGGFGIRARTFNSHEAVAIAMQLGGRPVKVVWSREDDISRDWFDPRQMVRFQGVIGDNGLPSALQLRAVGDSINAWSRPQSVAGGFDFITMLGLIGMPYAIPNKRVEATIRNSHHPVFFHRAPGHNHNVYMLEGFIDQLAEAAGQDPADYRRQMLSGLPNWVAVLDAAVANSNWGRETSPGFGRGIALGEAFGSVVVSVAEVSVSRDGRLKVERVDCAIDCGHVVNPLTVREQVESCVVYGLSSALYGEITFDNGVVQQQNFHSYPVMRMADMPLVNTHLVPSGGDNWGGIGEVALPSAVAAVMNAIYAASGVRVHRLPVRNMDLSWGQM